MNKIDCVREILDGGIDVDLPDSVASPGLEDRASAAGGGDDRGRADGLGHDFADRFDAGMRRPAPRTMRVEISRRLRAVSIWPSMISATASAC